MSRYAILRSFIEDEEEIAAFERAEENYQESEDINAPYEELERVIAEDRRRHDLEAEQFHDANYYHEEYAGEVRAARLAEEILAEAYAEEPAEEEDRAEDADYGNASPDASTAADEERSDPGLAGMPPMFDGDCAIAARFINDWDEWSSTLSVQFSQFQLCAIFLSLFRPPVDHWAEQRLLQIRRWRDEGMTDDDDALLEDIIGRFMEEFVPRDDAREEYVGDAAEDPENPDDWETVDDGESTDDGEVPPPPSLCRDDSQDFEEEPGEVEEYGCQDEVDEYYHSDDANTPDEAGQQYVDYGKVPLPYDAERDYADAILGRTRTHLEERVHPTPRKQKKRKTRAVNKKKAVKRPTAKSPPTWESRYIRRFGKARLQMLRNGGIPDYMIEEELLPPKPTTTPHDYEEGRLHNEWTGPETFNRPAAEPASWRGPNTFAVPAYQAAPADLTPASWGSAEADAAQESRAAENTGWFAYQSNPNAMDIGRMRLRAEAKCHHCWRTGHTRRNCPFRDEPRRRSWMADYNNDCDDPMPRAAPPRADYRMPRADPPQAALPRGRSPTVKPVHGSNVATYAPTTRYEPTVITVPETQRRAPTPSPSPISDAGFKHIQHHVISTDHGTYQVPLLSPDELADALQDTHIHAVQAAEEGQYLRAANLCERARLLTFPDQLPRQYEETVMQAAVGKLEREMAKLAEEYERKVWKRRQGQLQKLEDQLGDVLIIGDDEEAQQLDDKAIRLAKVLAATDEDRDKALPIDDTDILIQRGRCVTFRPGSGHWRSGMTPRQQYIVMDLLDQSAGIAVLGFALLTLLGSPPFETRDPRELIPSSPSRAVDTYPVGSQYHQVFLYHNERVARPYGYIYIVDHPSWRTVVPVEDPPVDVPQAEDLHAFIALNGDLAPHPAEYTNAITNRLFYRPLRIAAINEA
ncbi:hypothetical protein EDB86DRAFT_2837508 [Lactarius hatsudake]|nr:hypothetical protein EDB86DRAFT_2837508 [Lactarius hatsudake]